MVYFLYALFLTIDFLRVREGDRDFSVRESNPGVRNALLRPERRNDKQETILNKIIKDAKTLPFFLVSVRQPVDKISNK